MSGSSSVPVSGIQQGRAGQNGAERGGAGKLIRFFFFASAPMLLIYELSTLSVSLLMPSALRAIESRDEPTLLQVIWLTPPPLALSWENLSNIYPRTRPR